MERLSNEIVAAVGGKDNISHVLHCATRLRLNLKDESIPNVSEIEKIEGVYGCQMQSGQFQIIIGQEVGDVYDQIISDIGIEGSGTVDEYLDSDLKKKVTVKSVASALLDGVSGSIAPLMPMIMASAMFKLVTTLLGPLGANVLAAESDLYRLFDIVGDAGFYFLPVASAYTAAKKFNCPIMPALLVGFIFIHPNLVALQGQPFSVYGIPATVQQYSSTVLPSILTVWLLSYINAFIKRHMPKTLDIILTDALSLAIILPLQLCVIGPAGSFLGTYITGALFWLHDTLGPVGVAVVAGTYMYLVMTGMHLILVMQMMIMVQSAPDTWLVGGLWNAVIAVVAIGAALLFRTKNKETKALATACFTTAVLAGLSEPTLFGICMKYKRPLWTLGAGAAIGGLVTGLLGVTCNSILCMYSNYLGIVGWIMTSDTTSLIHLFIGLAVSFAATFFLTYRFGFPKEME